MAYLGLESATQTHFDMFEPSTALSILMRSAKKVLHDTASGQQGGLWQSADRKIDWSPPNGHHERARQWTPPEAHAATRSSSPFQHHEISLEARGNDGAHRQRRNLTVSIQEPAGGVSALDEHVDGALLTAMISKQSTAATRRTYPASSPKLDASKGNNCNSSYVRWTDPHLLPPHLPPFSPPPSHLPRTPYPPSRTIPPSPCTFPAPFPPHLKCQCQDEICNQAGHDIFFEQRRRRRIW